MGGGTPPALLLAAIKNNSQTHIRNTIMQGRNAGGGGTPPALFLVAIRRTSATHRQNICKEANLEGRGTPPVLLLAFVKATSANTYQETQLCKEATPEVGVPVRLRFWLQ